VNHDEVMALPEVAREALRWDLSSRWRCVLCGDLVYLHVAAVIGNYCCGGCGMATLRPLRYELPAWDGRFLVRWRASPHLVRLEPPGGDRDCFMAWGEDP
jgi:hypothetical protein